MLQAKYEVSTWVENDSVEYFALVSYVNYDGYLVAVHDDAPQVPTYLIKKFDEILIDAEEKMVAAGIDYRSREYFEVFEKEVRKRLRRGDRPHSELFASLLHRYRYAYGCITPLFHSRRLGITDVTIHMGGGVEVESYKFGKVPTNIQLSTAEREYLARLISAYVTPVSAYSPYASQVDQRYRVRVTAAVRPISPEPVFAFRLLGRASFTPASYVASGAATAEQLAYLWAAWTKPRRPPVIFAIGEPGTGKTTLVDVVIQTTPPDKPLAVIESVQEISAPQAKVRLVERQSFAADLPSVRMKRLIQIALRMSVPYVATNEVLGRLDAEALLQASTIGTASITTIHAVSPEDLINRLKALGVPNYAVRYLASNSVVAVMKKEGTRRRVDVIYKSEGGKFVEVGYGDYEAEEVQVRAKILQVLSGREAFYNPDDWLLFMRDFYQDMKRALAAVLAME